MLQNLVLSITASRLYGRQTRQLLFPRIKNANPVFLTFSCYLRKKVTLAGTRLHSRNKVLMNQRDLHL